MDILVNVKNVQGGNIIVVLMCIVGVRKILAGFNCVRDLCQPSQNVDTHVTHITLVTLVTNVTHVTHARVTKRF